MKRVGRLVGLVGLVLLLVLMPTHPVLAVVNPTDTSIMAAKVFQNIFVDDDWLVFVRYDVNYETDPDESADETFLVALYDTDGSTLLYQRALNYYGHNIITIYLTPAQTADLTWGNEYVIKVMGNPSVFETLTEGVNMATRSLSASEDYISGDMDDSREDLGVYCINTAKVLGASWSPTVDLVTTGDKLNSAGVIVFNAAIPGLYTAIPGIYETAVAPPELEGVERTIILTGTISGDFTASEAVVGALSEATGTFVGATQTATTIDVLHTTVTMYSVGETATGAVSGETIVVSEVTVGQLEEAGRGRTGTRLRDALDNFGAWIGISGNAFGGIALFLLFAITAGSIFTATGNVHGAILVAIPVILMGNFMGLMSFAITWMLVIVVALLFSILFIMGRVA